MPQDAATQEGFQVWISGTFLEGVKVDDVTPQPDSSEAVRGGVLYTFLAQEGNLEARFDLTSYEVGSLAGSVGVGGPDGAAHFTQFHYP